MPSRPQISLSADAISSAWPRLSIWHGPANNPIGRSLANVTLPMATEGLGRVVSLMRRTIARDRPRGENPPATIAMKIGTVAVPLVDGTATIERRRGRFPQVLRYSPGAHEPSR